MADSGDRPDEVEAGEGAAPPEKEMESPSQSSSESEDDSDGDGLAAFMWGRRYNSPLTRHVVQNV